MATNTLAPTGLVPARNKIGGAPTYQTNVYYIRKGYVANNIAVGDLVKTGTSTNQGYIVPSILNDTNGLGVFLGVLPYFDLTQQQNSHGLNGSFQLASNPSADIPCTVCSDPFVTFRAQVSGGTYAQSWRGQNINWTSGTNAAPNAAGISVLSLDYTTLGTSNTLPFRIEGVAGTPGGPHDPANVNPWVEVSFNPAWIEMLQGTGI